MRKIVKSVILQYWHCLQKDQQTERTRSDKILYFAFVQNFASLKSYVEESSSLFWGPISSGSEALEGNDTGVSGVQGNEGLKQSTPTFLSKHGIVKHSNYAKLININIRIVSQQIRINEKFR